MGNANGPVAKNDFFALTGGSGFGEYFGVNVFKVVAWLAGG